MLIDFQKGTRSWTTVGASANIIEASWIALADALEYAIFASGKVGPASAEAAAERRVAGT